MSQSAADQVLAIKALVEQAKAVPMSASCMVNRGEMVSLLDRALTSIGAEQELARRQSGAEALEDAREQADRIISDAHDEAARLVAEDVVRAEAVAQASALSATTLSETEALKREADTYVDQRMAEFEAYMTKTLTQLKTLRTRLSGWPDARIQVKEFENGPPIDAPIAIRLLGEDLDALTKAAAQVEQLTNQTDLNTARREQGFKKGFELYERHRDDVQAHLVIRASEPNADSECFGGVGVDAICNE